MNQPNLQKRPLLVELIGPAGAGKTTLYQALQRCEAGLDFATLPPVWRFSTLAFYLKNLAAILPGLIGPALKSDRPLRRRELAWMAILNGWPELLHQKQERISKALILDQGPVFLMTVLSGFGPRFLRFQEPEGWWRRTYTHWGKALDLIIWLDAPDGVLAQRINSRSSYHIIKNKPEAEVKAFFSKFRSTYKDVVNRCKSHNSRLRLARITTEESDLDQLTARILLEISACEIARSHNHK